MILPADLLIALIVIVLISLSMAWLGVKASRGWSNLLALLAAGVLLLHALWLADNLLLAKILPVADVMAWANPQTPAMALLAGVAWARLKGPVWQKWLLVGALICIGIWRLIGPYVGSRPVIGPARWVHGICVQSAKSTCSAAAAATVLATDGITTSEAEMADLCLTSVEGTTNLELYRGLKIKTEGTAWRVVVFAGSAADLQHQPLPAIVSISDPGIPSGLMGIGNRHSVVVFAFNDDGTLDIGDPFTGGRQHWTLSEFSRAYQGAGLALARR